jgi:uncharacterized membrane protein YedE/YeeE
MNWILASRWSPYAAGVGIGILSWLTFLISSKPIGCSTAFTRTSGMFERLLRGDSVVQKAYYKEFPPVVDWEWMLVLGVVIGSLVSSLLSADFRWQAVPVRWGSVFGGSISLRFAVALVGGVFLGFGARWAGGCTSGHGISGALQLALSSWVAAICFFIGGILTAQILYGAVGA